MKNYRTLDAVVVVGSLSLVALTMAALVFIAIPQTQLPIVAGLAGTIFGGTVGAYGGARWSNRKADEPHAPGDVSLTLNASTPATDPEPTT